MFWRRQVDDVEKSTRKSIYSYGEWMLPYHYVTLHHATPRHATPRYAAVTRSKANEVSSSTSRTIRRWILVAATRFANYPKQLKASFKKIRRRYLGRSENNSDTHPPASSRPSLALGWMKRILSSCRHCIVLLRFTFPFISSFCVFLFFFSFLSSLSFPP